MNLLRDLQLLIVFTFSLCLLAFIYLILNDLDIKWYEKPPAVINSGRIIASVDDDFDKVVDGIHVQTGLVYDKGFDIVRGTCTACHSAKLVTQNRATKEGWTQMIRWMQETQGLWDLGENEPLILNYLSTHYAPENIGRRKNLDMATMEWYILDVEEDIK